MGCCGSTEATSCRASSEEHAPLLQGVIPPVGVSGSAQAEECRLDHSSAVQVTTTNNDMK